MLPIGIDCAGCDDKSIEYFITAGSKGTVHLHMKMNMNLHWFTYIIMNCKRCDDRNVKSVEQ